MTLLKSLPATRCEDLPAKASAVEKLRVAKEALAKGIVDFAPAVDLSPLSGRGVLVTGGASGFGAGVTETFAKAGAYVTFLDVSEAQGKVLEAKWRGDGSHVQFVHCDVTSWASQLAAFKAAIAFHPEGTLDHAFVNAGVGGHVDYVPSDDAFDAAAEPVEPKLIQVDISLTGAYYTIALAMHYLRLKKQAGDNKSVIITGSLASYGPLPQRGDYTGAKFGLRGLAKVFTLLGPPVGIRVNLIAPNYTETGLTSGHLEMIRAAGNPIGKIEDVVKAVARFACDKSIHGRSATIDPTGIFDLRDDAEGHNGAIVIEELLSTGRLPVLFPTV